MADGHATAEQRLVVALVRGVHGLRGAVRVEALTDRPETRFIAGTVLYREGTDAPLTIAAAEAVADGPGWRLRFREVSSREIADTLRGAYLEMTVRPEADLARGEVYWHEVLGVPVRDLDGTELGIVQDIYRVAENEVYIVGGGRYGSFDLPAVRAFIRIFAPRRGEIVIDAGALDLQLPKARRDDADRPRAPRRTSRRRKTPAAVEADGAGAEPPEPVEPPGPSASTDVPETAS
ncbi:MAG: ribosome maturation factor RimM [Candidatus Limnocylindrales bacterium]